ncbi:MAG: DUF2442 domain-containing protein [Waterburya sp.]
MAAQLTQQQINDQIEAAIVGQIEVEKTQLHACDVSYDREKRKLIIQFDNGCEFSCPVSLLQGVCHLSDDEISKVKVTPAGWGLTWEDADIDLGVNELVQGIFGTKAWMRTIAVKGGRSKSEKKKAASRENGKKGGRPKKLPITY